MTAPLRTASRLAQTAVVELLKPSVTNLVFVDTRGLVIANIRLMVGVSAGIA